MTNTADIEALIDRAIQAGIDTCKRYGVTTTREKLPDGRRYAVNTLLELLAGLKMHPDLADDYRDVTMALRAADEALKVDLAEQLLRASLQRYDKMTAGDAEEDPMVKAMAELGGRRWQKGDMDRFYFEDWGQFVAGIDFERGTVYGESISNNQLAKLTGIVEKVYYDVKDGDVHVKGERPALTKHEVKLLSGPRQPVNLEALISEGIFAAAEKLKEKE